MIIILLIINRLNILLLSKKTIMLVENEDVNTDILLSLPLYDLESYCLSSKQNNQYCQNNIQLQKKLKEYTLWFMMLFLIVGKRR